MRKAALLFPMLVELGIVAYRGYDLAVTGFLTSDEANYAYRAMYGLVYGDRLVFGKMEAAIFSAFQIQTASAFIAFLPFYLAFWSVASVVLFYKTVGLLPVSEKAKTMTMLSLPLLVTYSLLSASFLTEMPALVLASAAFYLWLRWELKGGSPLKLLFASLLFIAAALCREPYIFVSLGAALLFVFRGLRKGDASARPIILFAIPQLLVLGFAYQEFFQVFPLIGLTVSNGQQLTLSATFNLYGALQLFVRGLVVGWNPVMLLVSVLGFAYLLKRALWTLAFASLLPFAAYLMVCVVFSGDASFFESSGLSAFLRYSNGALIAYPLLASQVFERLSFKKGMALGIGTTCVLALVAVPYLGVVQSNLSLPSSYSTVGTSNLYEPYQAMQYFQKTPCHCPVYIAEDWKAGQLYLKGISGIELWPKGIADITFPDWKTYPFNSTVGTFYVMGTGPVSEGIGMGNMTPTFIQQAYGAASTGEIQFVPGSCDAMVGGRVIFDSPTGNLIEVRAVWSC